MANTLAIGLLALGIAPRIAMAIEITKPKAVVELFTSQGCSSCPPADAALREFNASDEILGLAMHVDYWDRLGWKDTFASPDNTKRQWQYARSLGERQVYTPQAIVNGRSHLVGSRKAEIEAMAALYANGEKGLSVPINLTVDDDSIGVEIPSNATSKRATLYAVYFNPIDEVEIGRGENAGKTIRYSNVVRKVEMVGMIGGKDMAMAFSIADIKRKGYKGCALILQSSTPDGNPGPIIGASVIRDL